MSDSRGTAHGSSSAEGQGAGTIVMRSGIQRPPLASPAGRTATQGAPLTEVVLFHHAQGLTAGVRQFADRLRKAGHRVTVPDLYDGKTFGTLEDGIGYAEEIGFDTIMER